MCDRALGVEDVIQSRFPLVLRERETNAVLTGEELSNTLGVDVNAAPGSLVEHAVGYSGAPHIQEDVQNVVALDEPGVASAVLE